MADTQRDVTLRGIDWAATFPFLRVLGTFKLATQPGKMVLALMLVVVMFVAGWVLDGLVGGHRVLPGEFEAFARQHDGDAFGRWRKQAREANRGYLAFLMQRDAGLSAEQAQQLVESPDRWTRAEQAIRDRAAQQREASPDAAEQIDAETALALRELAERRPRGVFREALSIKIDAFRHLVDAAVSLRFGFEQLDPSSELDRGSVIGATRTVAWALPSWLWRAHWPFMLIWLVVFIATWSLLGGAISRIAVVEAASGQRPTMSEGVSYAFRRWLAFALMPLVPLIFFGLLALLLAVAGLLFHIAVLDIVAALLWVIAIPIGLILASGLIGWLGAVNLMYPALAAEGSDLFDGVSRSYSYVVTRPWRFIFHTLVALGYGAVTYLFVGLVVFLALYLAHWATGAWSPFGQLMPQPQLGELGYTIQGAGGWSDQIAATVIKVWVMLTIGLVAAYAVSYYFCAYGLIYLLLRKACDGTDAAQVYQPQAAQPAPDVVVSPVEQADDR